MQRSTWFLSISLALGVSLLACQKKSTCTSTDGSAESANEECSTEVLAATESSDGKPARSAGSRSGSSSSSADNERIEDSLIGDDSNMANGEAVPPSSPIVIDWALVRSVATSAYGTCAVLDDGRVSCWGSGLGGQLGTGITQTQKSAFQNFVDLGADRTAKSIVGAGYSFCATLDNDTLKCWGPGHGPHGTSQTSDILIPPAEPVFFGQGRTLRQVAISPQHGCAILDDATIKCWGNGSSMGFYFPMPGQPVSNALGYGSALTNSKTPPAQTLDLGTNFTPKQVVVASGLSCALSQAGAVKCWGEGSRGQLGLGSGSTSLDMPSANAIDLGSGLKALQIGASTYEVCALLENSVVKCWGANAANTNIFVPTQVDLQTQEKPVKLYSGGERNHCVVFESGQSKCWGRNDQGNVGYGEADVDIAKPRSEFIPLGGTGRKVESFSLGIYHSCLLYTDKGLSCYGRNYEGQLGKGLTTEPVSKPLASQIDFGQGRKVNKLGVSDGQQFACALLSDDSFVCWGYGTNGQLGLGRRISKGVPAKIPSLSFGSNLKVIDFDLGRDHVCVILTGGSVKCMGLAAYGVLGKGTTGPDVWSPETAVSIDLGVGRTALQISGSQNHNCALLDDKSVKCWGTDKNLLGYGSAGTPLLQPSATSINLGGPVKQLDAGYSHSCAVLENGTAKCWGLGDFGKLGMGNTSHLLEPSAQGINVGDGKTVVSIYAGNISTCALLNDGQVKCWGYNSYGLTGTGATGMTVSAPLSTPVALGNGNTAKALSYSGLHACAILQNDTAKCWGFGNYGDLGYGNTSDLTSPRADTIDFGGRELKSIHAGIGLSCAHFKSGDITCWGYADKGALGLPEYAVWQAGERYPK